MQAEKSPYELLEEANKPTPLSRTFSFWTTSSGGKGRLTREDYEKDNKLLGNISTVEEFWTFYQHMVRPDKLPTGGKFCLFQEGIHPSWEDKENDGGSSFILKVKKNYANKFWEELLISYIGEQCEENDQICGLLLNVKEAEVVISVWMKPVDQETREYIASWIKQTLGLNERTTFQFKYHPKNRDDQPPYSHSHTHSHHQGSQ